MTYHHSPPIDVLMRYCVNEKTNRHTDGDRQTLIIASLHKPDGQRVKVIDPLLTSEPINMDIGQKSLSTSNIQMYKHGNRVKIIDPLLTSER